MIQVTLTVILGCGGDGELNDKPCSPGHVGGRSAMVTMPTTVPLSQRIVL